MKLKYKAVIFDLDGTLVDTLGDIAASMNRALTLHGFPPLPDADYRDKVGWGIERLAFLSLPEETRQKETAAAVAQDAAGFYAENPLGHSSVYPGIPELLSTLLQKKIKTAVLSNKPDAAAQRVIAGLFSPGSFVCVQGEVAGRPRKPDPSSVWELLLDLDITPSNVIFVGDSEVDMETATSSGCFALGVGWGYRSREAIMKAGARLIIEKPEELLELFNK